MKRELEITLSVLVALTLTTILLCRSTISSELKNVILFIISFLKIILVSFYFMELKKAHLFWKLSLSTLIIIIFVVATIV